jgi:RNA polymerase sigma factor (sigma-70 family)
MSPEILQTEEIPDEILIKRILTGEKRLFELIVRRYNQRLFRIGMSVLNNDTEAEDAMQTTYINSYEHLDKFESRSSFSTWITRIMINECLAQKKKRQRFKTAMDQQPVNTMSMAAPDHLLANKELSSLLENAIGQLPEKYRLVFILREIEELSIKETSEVLNIEAPNVKVRLNRAKTMVKETLNGQMKDQLYHFHLNRCDRMVNKVFAHLRIN